MKNEIFKLRTLGLLAAGSILLAASWTLVQAQGVPPDSGQAGGFRQPSATKGADSGQAGMTRAPSGEGELIELEAVEIHGEIAQPNVGITVARAAPGFREITLERTPAEALSDLDLSGLKEGTPPPEKIRNWKELVKRVRR